MMLGWLSYKQVLLLPAASSGPCLRLSKKLCDTATRVEPGCERAAALLPAGCPTQRLTFCQCLV